jgi:hypothetical protein
MVEIEEAEMEVVEMVVVEGEEEVSSEIVSSEIEMVVEMIEIEIGIVMVVSEKIETQQKEEIAIEVKVQREMTLEVLMGRSNGLIRKMIGRIKNQTSKIRRIINNLQSIFFYLSC